MVPRLRVRKDWYKGLDDDPIDHTHPDIGLRPDAQDGSTGLPLTEPCEAFRHHLSYCIPYVIPHFI